MYSSTKFLASGWTNEIYEKGETSPKETYLEANISNITGFQASGQVKI